MISHECERSGPGRAVGRQRKSASEPQPEAMVIGQVLLPHGQRSRITIEGLLELGDLLFATPLFGYVALHFDFTPPCALPSLVSGYILDQEQRVAFLEGSASFSTSGPFGLHHATFAQMFNSSLPLFQQQQQRELMLLLAFIPS
ncbi:hypothetical protein AXG93_3348s1130 [Marchantia polymorpha subsp. ruderalis]|uniref:Uncharacterized protein n=1 Tax=Marchantia polymorpha subsp. ruderalis TaxID=1480154 RepID=A0A176VR46_MARPO|nr:hypothetical protein AXG93_3348s1130 [Marchantia polymorpha subsp. ruderalis]